MNPSRRRRISRIFTGLDRPRLGLSERDVALRLRPRRTGHVLLGAIGFAPSLKSESPEFESAEVQMQQQRDDSLAQASIAVGLFGEPERRPLEAGRSLARIEGVRP